MPPSTPLPRLLHSPQKTNSRIVLTEINDNNNPYQRYERYTLQEVITSPTYYGTASLSPRSSVASTISTRSDRSSLSQSNSYSPPSSPISEKDPFLPTTTTTRGQQDLASSQRPSRPSWTSSMDVYAGYHTPFMIRSDLPLGWLRPSLSSTAVLDMTDTYGHPYFVFLGFGQTDILMDLFGLNGPIPLNANGISERSFFWQVEERQHVMCTLATFPYRDGIGKEDGGSPYLENLTLNRIGVTSILLALPVDSTVNDIMGQLGHINKSMASTDPQGTWWERVILVFYPKYSNSTDLVFDHRSQLVQTTLPNLMHHIPVLPCVTLLGNPSYQAQRLIYQQACMHQTDHGWWHGSTPPIDDTSDSSDEDDGVLLPVAIMIGNKPTAKKKKPLFTIDTPSPTLTPAPTQAPAPAQTPSRSYSFLSSPPPPTSSSSSPVINNSTVELKHRFSKKWTEAPRRHHTKRSDMFSTT